STWRWPSRTSGICCAVTCKGRRAPSSRVWAWRCRRRCKSWLETPGALSRGRRGGRGGATAGLGFHKALEKQYMGFHAVENELENRVGFLEEGKLADLIVIDRDLLTRPVDDIKDTQVLRTYLGGKLV